MEYIFTIDGIKVFLSERLSQDPLEKFFGCQRQRGTTNENPNVVQFCKNTQALRVINGVCGNISKSNCRGNKTSVDWGKENCQLPKRRKCKMIQAVTLPEQQDHLVGNSAIKEDSSDIVMSSSNTTIQAVTLPEQQDDLVGNSAIKEDSSDIVMSSSNTTIQAVTLPEQQDLLVGNSAIKEGSSDIVMSSSNTTIQAVTLPEQQDHLVGNSAIKESSSDIVMSSSNTTIQAITLPEQQDHLVGNSTIKEDPSEIIMSLNTTKQEEFNHDKIAQPVYPSQLIQLINNAIESGRAEEELSNGFHISLKRSDFWLLRETGWLNDKVSKQ